MRARRFRPFDHLGLKVLAVALALLLWLVVAGEETVERSVRVPLELQQVPIGLDLMSDPPATVDVLVRGASDAIGRMSPGDLVAVLDLRSAREGRRLFPLTPNEVRAPFGVEVVGVSPNTVAMTFEREGTIVLPVAPAVEGVPAPGFVIGQIVSNPATVQVVGPASALGHVKAAMTEPVIVTNANKTIVEKVTVGVADPFLRLKTPTTASVTVNVIPAPDEQSGPKAKSRKPRP
jgi:YbbR domain-containing protein